MKTYSLQQEMVEETECQESIDSLKDTVQEMVTDDFVERVKNRLPGHILDSLVLKEICLSVLNELYDQIDREMSEEFEDNQKCI